MSLQQQQQQMQDMQKLRDLAPQYVTKGECRMGCAKSSIE